MSGRVLVLIRHAKAVAQASTDARRPLADRGRLDAAAAGRWLTEIGVVPDLVVVSPAVRARETWDGIAVSIEAAEARVDDRIYENTVDDLFLVIGDTPTEVSTLVLVGHNPSMHGLAITLDDGNGEAGAEVALREGYPTCGITVLDVAAEWSDLANRTATLRAFAAPRG